VSWGARTRRMGKHLPEVLVTDIEMPKMSGLKLTACVKELYPDTRALILTTFTSGIFAASTGGRSSWLSSRRTAIVRIKEWTGVLSQDLKYALRQLVRNRGFAAVAILTIGLGIGANTAIFSVADAVLLRPLPYPESGQLVLVWDRLAKIGVRQMPISAEDFDAFRTNTRIFQSVVAFQQQHRIGT
jgi:CheY-like chemotaxis protein